jgi:hypothetical protein
VVNDKEFRPQPLDAASCRLRQLAKELDDACDEGLSLRRGGLDWQRCNQGIDRPDEQLKTRRIDVNAANGDELTIDGSCASFFDAATGAVIDLDVAKP